MTIEEFLEAYNYAPYDLSEIAGLLSTVSDAKDVVNIADAFLEAQHNFEMALDDIGFEFG